MPNGFVPVFAQLTIATGLKGSVVAGVVVAETALAVVVVFGVVVTVVVVDVVVVAVCTVVCVSSSEPLSATTGCAGVATSVDSSVAIKIGNTGIELDVASITFGGSGAVARHCFLPFASPHTQTTDFFLRTFPGVKHATDFPLAAMVAYHKLLSRVFAHTTDTLETFVTWPGFLQAVPATRVALRV